MENNNIKDKINFFENINREEIIFENFTENEINKFLDQCIEDFKEEFGDINECNICSIGFNSHQQLYNHYMDKHNLILNEDNEEDDLTDDDYDTSDVDYDEDKDNNNDEDNNSDNKDDNNKDDNDEDDEDNNEDNNEDDNEEDSNDEDNSDNRVTPDRRHLITEYGITFTEYRCLDCGEFYTDEDDHECIEDNDPMIDNIPTSIFGRHECPICGNKYLVDSYLGEHFFLSHNNFSEFKDLDDSSVCNGFPGFNLLKHIDMIDEIDIDKIEVNDRKCSICYQKYKNKKIEEDKKDYEYTSDNEINYAMENNVEIVFKNNDPFFFDDMAVIDLYDEKLIDIYEKYDNIVRLPLMLTCCDKTLCHDCLEEYCTFSNSIICPFCKKNHEQLDQDYIITVEISKINEKLWEDWWMRHVDLFY